MKEPVVTAMSLDYGNGHRVEDDEWGYWYARYYGYLSQSRNLEPNGEPLEFDDKKLEADYR